MRKKTGIRRWQMWMSAVGSLVTLQWMWCAVCHAQLSDLIDSPGQVEFVNPNEHFMDDEGPVKDPAESNRQQHWASEQGRMLASQKHQGPTNHLADARGLSDGPRGGIQPQPDLATRVSQSSGPAQSPSSMIADSQVQPASLNVPLDPQTDWSRSMQSQLRSIDWTKMVGSLVLVIGGYLVVVAMLRRWSPQGHRVVPMEVVEMVGMVRLDARRHLQLIRLGSKLLLVAHGPEGIATIGEIDDPHEVEYLVQQCGRSRSRSKYEPVRMPLRDKRGKGANDLTLEKLVQSLQQAIRNPTGQAEFEA